MYVSVAVYIATQASFCVPSLREKYVLMITARNIHVGYKATVTGSLSVLVDIADITAQTAGGSTSPSSYRYNYVSIPTVVNQWQHQKTQALVVSSKEASKNVIGPKRACPSFLSSYIKL